MLDIVATKQVDEALAIAKDLGWKGVISLDAKGAIAGSSRPGAIFVAQQFSEKSRPFVEKGLVDCIYGFETLARKDSLHQRNSGLNDQLAAIMHKKDVAYGISLAMVLAAQKRGIILGRIMQNIVITRKAKIPICLASFATSPFNIRSPSDLAAFGESLGLRPEEAKRAIAFSQERILINEKKRRGEYVSKDLYVE